MPATEHVHDNQLHTFVLLDREVFRNQGITTLLTRDPSTALSYSNLTHQFISPRNLTYRYIVVARTHPVATCEGFGGTGPDGLCSVRICYNCVVSSQGSKINSGCYRFAPSALLSTLTEVGLNIIHGVCCTLVPQSILRR
jgi:hypothetical protein